MSAISSIPSAAKPAAPAADLTGIQRLSALCAAGCSILAVAIPAGVAGLWALASWNGLALARLLPPDILEDMQPIQLWQRLAGAAICLVPALLVSTGLLRVRRSLRAFGRGEFFTGEVVAGVRGYAQAMVWAAVAGILSVPVLSIALTFANPAGHRELSLDLSGGQVLNLLGAAIVWLVAAAMSRAAGIQRENEQFV